MINVAAKINEVYNAGDSLLWDLRDAHGLAWGDAVLVTYYPKEPGGLVLYKGHAAYNAVAKMPGAETHSLTDGTLHASVMLGDLRVAALFTPPGTTPSEEDEP